VSGILYDKFSPSAIINVDGSEYLVKLGDVVNKFKIASIAQDKVTVKYNNNIYVAKVGEIFSLEDLSHTREDRTEYKFGSQYNGIDRQIKR